MTSSKKRILNVLKGQLMYANENSILSEQEKNEFINIINILIEKLLNIEEKPIKLDINSLNKQLSQKINKSKSYNLKKMYTILKGQLMLITDILAYKEEQLNQQLYIINDLKETLDNIDIYKKNFKKTLKKH